jgi:hypothetical protein
MCDPIQKRRASGGNRTPDLVLTKDTLYRLSH